MLNEFVLLSFLSDYVHVVDGTFIQLNNLNDRQHNKYNYKFKIRYLTESKYNQYLVGISVRNHDYHIEELIVIDKDVYDKYERIFKLERIFNE